MKSTKVLLREALDGMTNRGYIIDKGETIIKVTKDRVEYENAVRLVDSPNPNFVNYHSAETYKVVNGVPHYKLVMDKLTELSDVEEDAIDLILNSLGLQEYMLDNNKRGAFLRELKANPEWYEGYGAYVNIENLVESLYHMYKYAQDNGFKLLDLRSQNLGRTFQNKLVHFDLGSG